VRLAALTGEGVWKERAERSLLAFAEEMIQAPLAHVTLVRALEQLLALPGAAPRRSSGPATAAAAAAPAEPGSLEDAARDVVEVDARLESGADEEWKPFRVELAVARGWHINANPAGDGLVPTTLAGVLGRVREVRYPAGEAWEGTTGPVPIYRGRVTLAGEIEHRGGGAPGVEVSYQACDETRCLPPVTRIVRLR
jgi:uncharacterized protein